MLGKILQTLMFKKNIHTAQLARETNIPKQTLNRIVNGTSPHPHAKNLQPLADYFDISVAQLKGDEPISEELVDIGLPTTKPKAKIIPLLKWEQLNQKENINVENHIYVSNVFSDQSFAVSMHDTSMEPVFAKGMLLIFDPQKSFSDRSYILVKLKEVDQIIFRQLVMDGEYKYLKPLSPDLNKFPMRLLNAQDKIFGILIEARQMFNQED